jgi:hypothetical protein
MGYVDFDGERYFDARRMDEIAFDVQAMDPSKVFVLPSNSNLRQDGAALDAGNLELAQKNKEELEKLQRADRKLRQTCTERRKKGGKKFANV